MGGQVARDPDYEVICGTDAESVNKIDEMFKRVNSTLLDNSDDMAELSKVSPVNEKIVEKGSGWVEEPSEPDAIAELASKMAYRSECMQKDPEEKLTEEQSEDLESLKALNIDERAARIIVLHEGDEKFWSHGKPLFVNITPLIKEAMDKCKSTLDPVTFWDNTALYVRTVLEGAYAGVEFEGGRSVFDEVNSLMLKDYIVACGNLGFSPFDDESLVPSYNGQKIKPIIRLRGLEQMVFNAPDFKSCTFKRSDRSVKILVSKPVQDALGNYTQRALVEEERPEVITCVITADDGRSVEGCAYPASDARLEDRNDDFWLKSTDIMLEHVAFKRAALRFLGGLPGCGDETSILKSGTLLTAKERRAKSDEMTVKIGRSSRLEELVRYKDEINGAPENYGKFAKQLLSQIDIRMNFLTSHPEITLKSEEEIKARKKDLPAFVERNRQKKAYSNPFLHPQPSNCSVDLDKIG